MWSVAELDRGLKRMLETNTAGVRVRGEVSGLHRAASRHVYFTLKDEQEDAVIDCVMYRTAPPRARNALEEGESVVLVGRVTVYPPRGRMQLVADDLLQTARGALLEALEQLKAKLAAEGLFDQERKQPLPAKLGTVAVLTSPDGAAIHDVIRVAFQRGRVRILLVPTPVQGSGAAVKIAEAIATADRLSGVDAIVVTRGGGSLEDLAAYNDELVVRAIAAARRPVVSAVGHEIDVSLSDLAADVTAATPSQAAELLVPSQREQQETLGHLRRRLTRGLQHRLAVLSESLTRLRHGLGEPKRRLLEEAQRFDELSARLERAMGRRSLERRNRWAALDRRLQLAHPRRVLHDAALALGALEPRLAAAMRTRLRRDRSTVREASARIEALSPLAVLGRGYAIATTAEGHALRGAEETAVGETLRVRLHRGRLTTRVEEID